MSFFKNIFSEPAAGGGALDQEQTIYVGKAGDDTNNGLSVETPKLTIAAAITAANALTPTPSNRVVMRGIDAGEYAEEVNIPDNCDFIAPAATITGSVGIGDDCTIVINRGIFSGTEAGFFHVPSAGVVSRIQAREITVSGTAKAGIDSANSGGLITAYVDIISAGANCYGVNETSVNGTLQLFANYIEMGNSAIGLRVAGTNRTLLATVNTLTNSGGGVTGAKGIETTSAANTAVNIGVLFSNTAYDIASGTEISGYVGTLNGTQTVAGGGIDEVVISGNVIQATSPTKGDWMVYGTAWTKLAVGADDEVPIADSGEATGIRWGTPTATAGYLQAGVSVEGNAVATSIAASSSDFSNKVQVAVFDTTEAGTNNCTVAASNDEITTDVAGSGFISVHLSFSGGANDVYSFAVFKGGGATQVGPRCTRKIGSGGGGDVGAASLLIPVVFTATDAYRVYIQNETNTDDPTIEDASFVLYGVTT